MLIYDPEERWCHPFLAYLTRRHIPCFLAGGGDNFVELCRQELPALVLIDRHQEVELPELRAPDEQICLDPLVATVVGGLGTTGLDAINVRGPEALRQAWEALQQHWAGGEPAAQSNTSSP